MNAWKYFFGISLIVLFANVYGCATGKSDYTLPSREVNNSSVPLLIYNTSWNFPQRDYSRLAVWVTNTRGSQINSIELTVAPCGAKGGVGASVLLVLGGPFYGHNQYVSLPSWPIKARYYPSAGYIYIDNAKSSGHMVIQSVKIMYADGKQVTYNKNVDQLLTKNISNYCPNNMSF